MFTAIAIGLSFVSLGQPGDVELRGLIERYRESFHVPGLAVAIVRDGKTVLIEGFGKRDSRKPVDADTIFPIGSCTKAFTSAAIASLVADKKMTWDDPVRTHLPTFHLSDPKADRLVTIRDLLSHRTGLNGHDLLWYRASWSLDEAIGRIGKLPLHGPFRESFHYSSLTVAAAGRGVAKSMHTTWPDLIRDRVAKPAGIRDIAFTTKVARAFANRATGYRIAEDGRATDMPEWEQTESNPAGSIHLSARGLERWLIFQLDPKQSDLEETKSAQIDVPVTDLVKAYHPTSPKVQYGMGWLIAEDRDSPVRLHGGMVDGYRCQVTLYPREKLGIALLNNAHDSSLNIALTYAIADRLLMRTESDWAKTIHDLETRQKRLKEQQWQRLVDGRRAEVPPDVPLAQFTGAFENPGYGRGQIELDEGKLVWVWSQFRVPLEHWERNTFRMMSEPFTDKFISFAGDAGVVKKLTFAEQTFTKAK